MNMATRSAAKETERGPEIHTEGSTVRYSRALRHQCCRSVGFHHQVEGSEIKLVEFWTGAGCRCICFSSLDAVLEKVPPGHYTVNVYQSGLRPGTDELLPELLVVSAAIQVAGTSDE